MPVEFLFFFLKSYLLFHNISSLFFFLKYWRKMLYYCTEPHHCMSIIVILLPS